MGLQSVLAKSKFFVSKHSPEICMIAGAIELGLTIVSACKGTMKFQKAIENHNRRLEKLDALEERIKDGEEVDDDIKDVKSDRILVYTDTLKEAVKCYWPTILLSAGTLTTFGFGFHTLNERLVGVSAVAASALERTRFLEKHIEDTEGREALDKLNGKLQVLSGDDTPISESEKDPDHFELLKDRGSVFSIWWDVAHPDYSKQPGANKFTIARRLRTCQERLEQNGYLFYNEALRIFGYDGKDLKEAGQIYGWKWYGSCGYDEAKRHGAANRVDIGFNPDDPRFEGNEYFLLQFNVDLEPIIGSIGFGKKNDREVPYTA